MLRARYSAPWPPAAAADKVRVRGGDAGWRASTALPGVGAAAGRMGDSARRLELGAGVAGGDGQEVRSRAEAAGARWRAYTSAASPPPGLGL